MPSSDEHNPAGDDRPERPGQEEGHNAELVAPDESGEEARREARRLEEHDEPTPGELP